MRVKIAGRYWNLQFKYPGKDRFGTCDDPRTPNKAITIHPHLTGELLIDVILHETMHAAESYESFGKFEDSVNDLATDQAHLLCHPEILSKILDNPQLLDAAKGVLEKHGWTKNS